MITGGAWSWSCSVSPWRTARPPSWGPRQSRPPAGGKGAVAQGLLLIGRTEAVDSGLGLWRPEPGEDPNPKDTACPGTDRGTERSGDEALAQAATVQKALDTAPPQDFEAERAALGAALLDAEARATVFEQLTPADFLEPRHGWANHARVHDLSAASGCGPWWRLWHPWRAPGAAAVGHPGASGGHPGGPGGPRGANVMAAIADFLRGRKARGKRRGACLNLCRVCRVGAGEAVFLVRRAPVQVLRGLRQGQSGGPG